MFDYPVNLDPQPDGGFVVTFPDIPEALTQGEDREEALLYAVDALETALSFYVDSRRRLPVPSKAKRGQSVVHPSALESAKLAIYCEMVEQGIKKSDLARLLGWHLVTNSGPCVFRRLPRRDRSIFRRRGFRDFRLAGEMVQDDLLLLRGNGCERRTLHRHTGIIAVLNKHLAIHAQFFCQ